ncbi:MAG: 30S ribosomal protein S6, partial [Planctomycetota bacterium]|nr:30S ribosomal protein S6 [Planctomycetota bacterium]
MKLYEGLFLFDANLAAKDWPGLEKHIGDLLTKNEAEMVYSERWPDRKLAYEVKGCRKGTYFLTYFNAPGPAITALHRDVQLSERILRLMVLQNEYIEEVLETHKTRQAEREAAREEKAAADAAASDKTPEVASTEASEATPEAEAAEAVDAPEPSEATEAPAAEAPSEEAEAPAAEEAAAEETGAEETGAEETDAAEEQEPATEDAADETVDADDSDGAEPESEPEAESAK